jgi:hypothetical protein
MDAVTRFWSRVDTSSGTDTCWLWTGKLDKEGRGRISIGGKGGATMIASRFSWVIAHGRTIPLGQQVCHACDNPTCVNPTHLFLGTQLDNIRDCISKGRFSPPPKLIGIQNHSAKLNERLVAIIRERYAAGGTSHLRLAKEYGVSETTIRFIIIGRIWRCTPRPA